MKTQIILFILFFFSISIQAQDHKYKIKSRYSGEDILDNYSTLEISHGLLEIQINGQYRTHELTGYSETAGEIVANIEMDPIYWGKTGSLKIFNCTYGKCLKLEFPRLQGYGTHYTICVIEEDIPKGVDLPFEGEFEITGNDNSMEFFMGKVGTKIKFYNNAVAYTGMSNNKANFKLFKVEKVSLFDVKGDLFGSDGTKLGLFELGAN